MRQWIEAREPLAAIRFGEASAKLLGSTADDVASLEELARSLRRQAGLRLDHQGMLELQMRVSDAFEEADVLGIGISDSMVDEHKAWVQRLAVLYAERVAHGRRRVPIAHCMFGNQLFSELPRLLAGRRVAAISCRDVKAVLEREWGAIDVDLYQVPSEYAYRDVDGPYEGAMHDMPIWPDAHSRVRGQLTVRERGEVFLVGAGFFGKDLCIHVRELGGIAIDVGSTLDRIAGKITRGPRRRALDLHRQGKSVEEIASQLGDLYGVEVEPQEVAAGLAEIEAAQQR